jgi:hypothetical protein
MRIHFSSMVAATILVAASTVGWKAEAAPMTGVGTLPLQTKSYTPVEKVAYWRRHYRRAYRRGYYGYGYPYYGYYGYGYRPYGYHGYGWRPGFSIYVGPRWGWGWGY